MEDKALLTADHVGPKAALICLEVIRKQGLQHPYGRALGAIIGKQDKDKLLWRMRTRTSREAIEAAVLCYQTVGMRE